MDEQHIPIKEKISFLREAHLSFVGEAEVKRRYYLFESEENYILISEHFLEKRPDFLKFAYVYPKTFYRSFVKVLKRVIREQIVKTTKKEIRVKIERDKDFMTKISETFNYNLINSFKFDYLIQNLLTISVILTRGRIEKSGRSAIFIFNLTRI